jgi:arginine decarboxylase
MSSLRHDAPLLDAYLSYLEKPGLPFTIPGHKQRATTLDAGLGAVVDVDVPLYGGLDEIKLTRQTLSSAEHKAAQLWTADYARFSTGGSTHANQAIVLALGKPGDKVGVARTAHRSVLSALVLAGLEPVWMMPDIDAATGVPTGISLSGLQKALEERPVAILLTEPGYLGTISDLPPLISLAHSHGIPVVIDAAWGGHFGFHPCLPRHALELGADALITSVHKALPGYSASALLLARTGLLKRDRLEQSFETTHTTSPSGAALASIDAVRALMQSRGNELLARLLQNIERFKLQVQSHFSVPIFLSASDFAPGRFDPTKLVLRAQQLGTSGVDVEKHLLEKGLRVEMGDKDTVVFLATLADTAEVFDTLAQTLIPVLSALQGPPRVSSVALSWSVAPQRALSMRDAYFAHTEMVPASQALGRISADLVAPYVIPFLSVFCDALFRYPPGVAVLAPGERLTQQILQGLHDARAAGVRVAYATDPTLARYRVLA